MNESRKQWKQIDCSIKTRYDLKEHDYHIRHSLEQWTYMRKICYIFHPQSQQFKTKKRTKYKLKEKYSTKQLRSTL